MIGVCMVCIVLGWPVVAAPDDAGNLASDLVETSEGKLEQAITREIGRLAGHRVTRTADGYTIDDIAGEGRPVVGIVVRRGASLYLDGDHGSYRLAGRLARPRIAGPGYKIWALGPVSVSISVSGEAPDRVLTPRRLGVLAPPGRVTRR